MVDFTTINSTLNQISQGISALNNTLNTLLPNGAYHPFSSSDAAAPTNSMYYSTDASKLVYKDSGGVVHALY